MSPTSYVNKYAKFKQKCMWGIFGVFQYCFLYPSTFSEYLIVNTIKEETMQENPVPSKHQHTITHKAGFNIRGNRWLMTTSSKCVAQCHNFSMIWRWTACCECNTGAGLVQSPLVCLLSSTTAADVSPGQRSHDPLLQSTTPRRRIKPRSGYPSARVPVSQGEMLHPTGCVHHLCQPPSWLSQIYEAGSRSPVLR